MASQRKGIRHGMLFVLSHSDLMVLLILPLLCLSAESAFYQLGYIHDRDFLGGYTWGRNRIC